MYITRGLLDVLLHMADTAHPDRVTIQLAVTDAGDLDLKAALDATTPVFSDLYFPNTGDAITAVFGVDVSVPPGQTPGLFVSHPDGDTAPASEDDLAEVRFIAVPPYTPDEVTAVGRGGDSTPLTVVETAERT